MMFIIFRVITKYQWDLLSLILQARQAHTLNLLKRLDLSTRRLVAFHIRCEAVSREWPIDALQVRDRALVFVEVEGLKKALGVCGGGLKRVLRGGGKGLFWGGKGRTSVK